MLKNLKRTKYLVIAVILLLLSSSSEGGNFKHINIGFLLYGKTSAPDSDVKWWAEHTDMAIISTPIPSLRWLYPKLKTFNPNIKVLMYQQGEDTGWAWYGDSELKKYAGSEYENTFLHVASDCRYKVEDGMVNAKENDRVHTYTKKRDMKNIKNSTYRNWWGDFAKEQMADLNADGVMADNWDLLKWHELPREKFKEYPCPGTYATKNDVEDAWVNDFEGMAGVIKKKIGDKMLLPNISLSAVYMGKWKDYLPDGALVETWGALKGGTEGYTGLDKFQSDLDAGVYANQHNRTLFVIMYSNKEKFPSGFAEDKEEGMNREQIYFLSEYYLIKGPKIYFCYQSSKDPQVSWFKALEADIGDPVRDYTTFATGTDPSGGGSYRVLSRKYTNGLVLVKPNQGGGSFGDEGKTTHKLDGAYRILKANGEIGEEVSSITLRNGEGAILLNKNFTAAQADAGKTAADKDKK